MEDFFRELGKENLESFKLDVPEQPGTTSYVAQNIRKSYVKPSTARSLPKDFKPDNDYFFQGDIGNRDKLSFETKTYNVEDAYSKLNNGDYMRKYDTYELGRDNAEFAAQSQSTGEKWANGLTKFGGKVLTGIIGGTIGTVNGVFEGIQQGSFRATYDNDFLNYLDDLNEKMDYKLPNYKSKEEADNSFFENMGTANFWAEDVLGGAAFTVSAIASEYLWASATGGASLATTAARIGQRAIKSQGLLGKVFRGVSEVKSLASAPVLKSFANAKLPTAMATKFGRAGQLANTARFMYTSAGFEAGVEARNYVRESKNAFKEEFISKNGYEPSQEDIAKFNDNLTNSANALYGFNTVIVGSSNLMTIGRIFDMKSPLTASSKWANSTLFGIGNNTVTGAAQVASKAQKVGQYAWSIGKSPLIEGVYEEGLQSAGSNTAKNWITSSYNPKYLGNTMDLSDAFTQGLSDTYGTKEGMKEVGIGMIIGLLTGTGISVAKGQGLRGELKGEIKNAKDIETFFSTNYAPNQVAQAIAFSNRVQSANEQADIAEAKGDFLGGELSRQTAIIAQTAYAQNLDYFDETLERTEVGIRNISDQAIMQEYGVSMEEVPAIKDKLVEDYKSTANTYKKNREFSEYYVGNNLTKEEKEKTGGLNLKEIKDAVAYELTLGEKVHDFSSDLLDEIKNEVGSSILGTDVSNSLNIENVLLKAGEEVRKDASKKESRIKGLETRRVKLERDYKEVEKTLAESVDPEQRKKILTRLDNLMTKKTQVEQEKQVLVKEYNILLNTAALRNPFGKKVEALFVTEETLTEKEKNLKELQELVNSYDQLSPQRGLKLKKLMEEYGKSMSAFKRYADLSRQLTDPKLGVRGKRNLVTELISGNKGVNEITTEFLQGLSENRRQVIEDTLLDRLEGNEAVQSALTGASIQPPAVPPANAGSSLIINDVKDFAKLTEAERQLLKDKVAEQINNFPKDMIYLTHLTPSKDSLKGIMANGLTTGIAIESTSNVTTSKQGLITTINSIIDGNLNHRDSANLAIIAFKRSDLTTETNNANTKLNFTELISDFIMANHPQDFGTKIPSQYSFASFTDGAVSLKNSNQSPVDQVAELRSQEQVELSTAIPNIESYKVNGVVDKKLITDAKDLANYNKIYKKYDKLITPLLNKDKPVEAKLVTKSRSIKQYVTDLIKNSPYLLEYYGSEVVPTIPTEAEMQEFGELATKALKDKRINNKTLSYEDPNNQQAFPQKGKKVKLTAKEIARLQELNNKLANWRLLEVYGSKEGVSIVDMLKQEVATEQQVEAVELSPEVGETELQTIIEVNPTETDTGETIRNSEILQTYEDVFMSEGAQGTSLHHLTMTGLLSRMAVARVGYAKVKTVKGGKETLTDVKDNVSAIEMDSLARSGGRFTIVFPDFTNVTIDIGSGSQLVFKNKEDFTRVLAETGIEVKTIQISQGKKVYYPVYDTNTGKKLKTTFSDANSYSPGQLYDLTPGEVVEFAIDLFSDENQRLIAVYEQGIAENKDQQDLEAELMANIQITASSTSGQKFSDLKAAYDTENNPQFLQVRLSALTAVKQALAEGLSLVNTKQKLPYQSSIKFLLIGTPNFVYEGGKMKFFQVNPKQIENYGYIQDGKLVAKNKDAGPIRIDFIKGMMKINKTPFIVVRQGNYSIAIPVSLNRTQLTKGDDFFNAMQQEVQNGNGRNLGQIALELNQLLAENNISPNLYNLYFLDSENQTLFDETGNITKSFSDAIVKLNEVQEMVDVTTWMDNTHTKESLVAEITSPIDTNDKIASSPKPIINFTEAGLQQLEGNWLDKALRTGEIEDAKATEIVDGLLTDRGVSPQILDLIQKNPKIQALLKAALKLQPKLKSKIKAVLNEIQKC